MYIAISTPATKGERSLSRPGSGGLLVCVIEPAESQTSNRPPPPGPGPSLPVYVNSVLAVYVLLSVLSTDDSESYSDADFAP